jgi:prepilin-type N-terminal cleavage/methylation domain-containing protein
MELFSVNKKLSGFTLIELLVSMSIIAIMAAISISAYPKFSAQLATTAESYRLLTFLRETQSYGISSLTLTGQKIVYGLEIDQSANTIKRVIWDVTNQNNLSFKFKNTDFLNNYVAQVDSANLFTLKDSFSIVKICDTIECDTENNVFDKGYVAYKRPNPDSRIIFTKGSGGSSIMTPSQAIDNDTSSAGKLVLIMQNKSKAGLFKKLIILSTGQMYIE